MAYTHTTANWQEPSHFEEAIQGIKEQEQGKSAFARKITLKCSH